MGNNRNWTTKFNAKCSELEAYVRSRAGRSLTKRKQAVQKAATMTLGQGAK